MKITKFRLFNLFAMLLILATKCTSDSFEYVDFYTYVPENLVIAETHGIKLENYIVENEVNINVKLPLDGTYRIKIKDITGKLVSQEQIKATQGDNILKIYVNSLPTSSYSVELIDDANIKLGEAIFSIKQ